MGERGAGGAAQDPDGSARVSDSDDPPTTTFLREETRVTGRRALAHLADGALYSLFAFIVIFAAAALSNNAVLGVALVLVIVFGQVTYFVLTQRRSGRSPGKRLVGIKVVDADGRVPSVEALVRRSIPLLFEYLYVISLAVILSSPDRQRLGDRWAHTYVIADDGRLESGGTENRFSCLGCGETFATQQDATAHVATFHPDDFSDPSTGVTRR